MTIDYSKLSKHDFDVIITGQLIHYCLHLESEINNFLKDYFLHRSSEKRKSEFDEVVLFRDCISLHNKIDILKLLTKGYPLKVKKKESEILFSKIDEMKSLRNALTHGFAPFDDESEELKVVIEITNKAGKQKRIEITTENHEKIMNDFEKLIDDFSEWKENALK